jgi:hypothetical protein
MYALPQGCSAKREIILIRPDCVQIFIFHTQFKQCWPLLGLAQTKAPPNFLRWTGGADAEK